MMLKHWYRYSSDESFIIVEAANDFEFLISPEDYDLIRDHRWFNNDGRGYLSGSGGKYRYKYLHRVIADRMGLDMSKQIDHINGIKHDNRRENLRSATNTQNQHNVGRNSKNTSGFKGVSWCKANNKWRAYIKINGKPKYLGVFETPELAHEAYKQAAIKHHGEFANTGVEQ